MKYVKALVIIAFVAAVAVFGLAEYQDYKNRDTSFPEITSDREVLELTCGYAEEQLMEGLQAYDAGDGDLTDQIIRGDISRFIEKGVCNVTYVVFDSSNHPASLTRKIQFTDYHSPRFALSDPLIFAVGEGTYAETVGRMSVTDLLDGDLTEWISQASTDINYQKEGTYQMTMEVTNSYGDTVSVSFPVHVIAEGGYPLEIRLTETLVYLNVGDTYDPAQWVEGVYYSDGTALGAEYASASSNVDSQTPGSYEIAYRAEDEDGNVGETWLTVVVQE